VSRSRADDREHADGIVERVAQGFDLGELGH
jgi:hypothetical protein